LVSGLFICFDRVNHRGDKKLSKGIYRTQLSVLRPIWKEILAAAIKGSGPGGFKDNGRIKRGWMPAREDNRVPTGSIKVLWQKGYLAPKREDLYR